MSYIPDTTGLLGSVKQTRARRTEAPFVYKRSVEKERNERRREK